MSVTSILLSHALFLRIEVRERTVRQAELLGILADDSGGEKARESLSLLGRVYHFPQIAAIRRERIAPLRCFFRRHAETRNSIQRISAEQIHLERFHVRSRYQRRAFLILIGKGCGSTPAEVPGALRQSQRYSPEPITLGIRRSSWREAKIAATHCQDVTQRWLQSVLVDK